MPLTQRQAEVGQRVARGLPNKVIARELQISVSTVKRHIEEAAARLPGDSSPRHRLTMFFVNIVETDLD